MALTIFLDDVPPAIPEAAAEDVRQWVWRGSHRISDKTARYLAQYFADKPGDAMSTLGACKPVEGEAVIFQALSIMRGPMMSVDEQQQLMALLAWASWRYAIEARKVGIRRQGVIKPH